LGAQSNLRLKKFYGQHLLVSPRVLKRIVEFACLNAEDVVVEIGPGTGNLTKEILKEPIKELHCLEIDKDMIEELKKLQDPRLKIYHTDASEFDYCLLGNSLKLLGNLPYNSASLILERTVLSHRCVAMAVFMVQKEVAQKLVKGLSWLGVFVKTFFEAEYLMTVPPRFFLPPPKVQSAVIRLTKKEPTPEIEPKEYKAFLTKLFSFRRKALKNKLPEELLRRASIDPQSRVEGLSLEEIQRLYFLSKA
jgi:16S rRNA (adenine1518-N6/adenine1519-N6)-dimethyltransferase